MAQLQQINKDFAGSGFNFVLADIDWTVNARWDASPRWVFSCDANGNNCDEAAKRDDAEMRRTLRKGGYSALNLYFQNGSFGGGYCYFPANAQPGSETFLQDGCYVSRHAVPGGAATGGNEGKVATHEIGHWLFLYHTFENGCTGAGDEVSDTPAEQVRTSIGSCRVSDTCPGLPGQDPINNYMTYTVE